MRVAYFVRGKTASKRVRLRARPINSSGLAVDHRVRDAADIMMLANVHALRKCDRLAAFETFTIHRKLSRIGDRRGGQQKRRRRDCKTDRLHVFTKIFTRGPTVSSTSPRVECKSPSIM